MLIVVNDKHLGHHLPSSNIIYELEVRCSVVFIKVCCAFIYNPQWERLSEHFV